MTVEVLYRKWRPSRFIDVVGQPAVIQTLRQAVVTDRVAHAYLFCGPRGTGKTSTARVLAKAIDCLQRTEHKGEPCGECTVCSSIQLGNFVDLIEIDAASNRGIDEMRDLREKVYFAPGLGVSKIYIIDEVHMLTDAASNAFLKTLEEPPPHAVFILCTTEPQRLPATVISRCQRFDFRRITPADLVSRLAHISKAEGVDVPPEALRLLALAAAGSLRDATNLLDQLITSYGGDFTLDSARDLLGIGNGDHAVKLTQHLLLNDTVRALDVINTVAMEGLDLRPLHRMTVECLRATLLVKSGVDGMIDLAVGGAEELPQLAEKVSLERIMRALRVFGQLSFRHDQPSPLPMELATVELSLDFSSPVTNPEILPQKPTTPRNLPPSPAETGALTQVTVRSEGRTEAQDLHEVASRGTSAAPSNSTVRIDPPTSMESISDHRLPEGQPIPQWGDVLRAISRYRGKRFNVGALLRSAKSHHLEGETLVIRFAHRSNVERLQEELADPTCLRAVQQILQDALGGQYSVRVEEYEGRDGSVKRRDQGHLVRAALGMGAQVVSEPIERDPWEGIPNE